MESVLLTFHRAGLTERKREKEKNSNAVVLWKAVRDVILTYWLIHISFLFCLCGYETIRWCSLGLPSPLAYAQPNIGIHCEWIYVNFFSLLTNLYQKYHPPSLSLSPSPLSFSAVYPIIVVGKAFFSPFFSSFLLLLEYIRSHWYRFHQSIAVECWECTVSSY